MIQPTRLPIDLARNSKPSSQRSCLVSQGSELVAPSQEPHISPCENPLTPPPPRITKLIFANTYGFLILRRLPFTKQNP